ncbi:hypothetical protein LCGC14_2657850, partial [marine sediment metagenome]
GPRFSGDANDQYRSLMALPAMVKRMQKLDCQLPPLWANITACGEWVVLDGLYSGLCWLKINNTVAFERLIPDGLVTIVISDTFRFADRPCVYLTCI